MNEHQNDPGAADQKLLKHVDAQPLFAQTQAQRDTQAQTPVQQQTQVRTQAQQQTQQQTQQLPLMANAQNLQQIVPGSTAQFESAFAEIHGGERMGFKERIKRKMKYSSKQKLAQSLQTQTDEFERLNNAAVHGVEDQQGPNDAIFRQANAWLDISGTPEAQQKNQTRMQKLTSGDAAQKNAETKAVIDEFLAMDISCLTYGTNRELVKDYVHKRDVIQKGMEIKRLVENAQDNGLVLDRETKVSLWAKADAVEMASARMSQIGLMMKNPYYALLAKNDSEGLDEFDLSQNMDYFINHGNAQLGYYYSALSALRNKKYSRTDNIETLYAQSLESRNHDADVEDALERRQTFNAAEQAVNAKWGPAAVGYAVVPQIDRKGALKEAGLEDRAVTRTSLVTAIFLQRSGKSLTDPLTDADRQQLAAVKQEVDNMLRNNNTQEVGTQALVEMAHGVLKTDMGALPIDTPENFAQNAPMLHHFFSLFKDFEQICAGNKACGEAAMAALTEEERRQFSAISGYRALFADAIDQHQKAFANPKYEGYLKGTLRDEDSPGFIEYQTSTIAGQFIHENAAPLRAVAQQHGAFRLPQGFTQTYAYFFSKMHGIEPQDEAFFANQNRLTINEMYGGAAQ